MTEKEMDRLEASLDRIAVALEDLTDMVDWFKNLIAEQELLNDERS